MARRTWRGRAARASLASAAPSPAGAPLRRVALQSANAADTFPLPLVERRWYAQQLALNQAIFTQLLALGITPILPVFQASERDG